MACVQAVVGAGIIHVVTRVIANQAIVRGVVHSAKAERGAHVIAFGGVIVDHV